MENSSEQIFAASCENDEVLLALNRFLEKERRLRPGYDRLTVYCKCHTAAVARIIFSNIDIYPMAVKLKFESASRIPIDRVVALLYQFSINTDRIHITSNPHTDSSTIHQTTRERKWVYWDNVSEKHLRAVLRALCKDTDICTKALAMVDKLEKAEGSAMADNNVGESEAKLAICVRCEKAFSIDDNEKHDCVYHNGDLYPDEDDPAWYEHDVRCHGDLDTSENRKNYPEAFLWDCCDEVRTTEGCKMGRHQVEPGEDSDSSEDSEDFESD